MPIDPRTLPARLRDPDYRHPTTSLGMVAGMQAAAAHGNIARNFGVGDVELNKGPFQCEPGFDLYAGQCIPKTRVLGAPRATKKNPYTTYTVRHGNTPSGIAAAHGVFYDALIAANPQKDTMVLRNGKRTFKSIVAGERLNIPASPKNLSGVVMRHDHGVQIKRAPVNEKTCLTHDGRAGWRAPGGVCNPILQQPYRNLAGSALGASAGDSCGSDGECDSGNCIVADTGYGVCAPSVSSNTPPPDNTQPGDPGAGDSTSGGVFCSANMHVDFTQVPPACVCDDGFTADASGACVQATAAPPATAAAGAACAYGGGTWDDASQTCSCDAGLTWNGTSCSNAPAGSNVGDSCGQNATVGTDMQCQCLPGYQASGSADGSGGTTLTCVKAGGSGGTPGGGTGGTTKPTGGSGTTKTGGGTTPPGGSKTSLSAPPSSTSKTLLMIGGLVAAAAAVGTGAYFLTKKKGPAGKAAPAKKTPAKRR